MKKLILLLSITCSLFITNRLSAQCHAAFEWEQVTNTLTIHFINQSTSEHDITSYFWNFGDGHTGDGQNPNHTYAEAGTYNVCLTIHDNVGCENTICHEVVVAPLSNNCEAGFTFVVNQDTHVVQFDNNSFSNHDIIHYSWTFGDGGTSDAENPTHTYQNSGTYTVCLTITDNTGCTDDICHNVVIEGNPCHATFTWNQGDNCEMIDFHDTSTGDPNFWEWNFGDGSPISHDQNPTHQYDVQGTYVVCLIIHTESGCIADHCTEVVVSCGNDGCHASFTAEPGDNPLVWHFLSTSTSDHDIIHYSWTFGDGGVSDNHAPNHTYDHGGVYLVCLTITDGSGCSDTFCEEITVVEDSEDNCTASFTAEAGDNPLVWHFHDTSTGDTDVNFWEWHFGDGSPVSHDQNPVHEYDQPGTYQVCLIIHTESGCIADHCITITVTNGDEDNCHAEFSSNHGDNPLVWHFHDQSTSDHGIVSWQWSFGDGGTSTLQNPEHVYNEPGTYVVCLIITSETGCVSDHCEEIHVPSGDDGCHAEFSGEAGDNPLVWHFTDQSTSTHGIAHWQWSFGDGHFSDDHNPVHEYGQPGTYVVCLIITSETGCVADHCEEIVVTGGEDGCHAEFYGNHSQNNNLVWHFHDQSTSEHGIVSWSWTFGDGGTSTSQNPEHVYEQPGTYVVCLTITSETGCVSDHCEEIFVPEGQDGCHAEFSGEHGGDNWLNWHFTDQSTSEHGIVSWHWTFGDGVTSDDQNPVHLYGQPGTYTVCLIIISESGCIADHCEQIVVTQQEENGCEAFFTWEAGDNPLVIHFFNHSESDHDIIHYIWHFGDGHSGDGQNPIHEYENSGNYEVCLTIVDNTGCEDTYCTVIEVNGSCHADFTWTYNNDTDSLMFNNISTGVTEHTLWLWTFGDDGTSTEMNPQHEYAENGIYTICLFMIDTTTNCSTHQCHMYVQDGGDDDDSNDFQEQEQEGESGFAIPNDITYTNPAENNMHLTYTLATSGEVMIELYDLAGHRIITEKFGNEIKGSHAKHIALPDIKAGMYSLVLHLAGQRIVRNVIIVE